MIFAHGPGSFLSAYLTRKFWGKSLSKKAQYYFIAFGVFVGVALDLDLIYYFKVSALKSHRENIGHSLIFHAIISLLILALALILKNKYLKATGLVYGISSLTHLILDSFSAGVLWFYPFSKNLLGLLSFRWFSESIFSANLYLISFVLEVVIIASALLVFVSFFKKKLSKPIYLILFTVVVVLCFFVASLFIWHSFNTVSHIGNPFYGDIDSDGIVNRSDEDVDGDGIINFEDPDANGNGISNVDEIVAFLPQFEGARFDPSNGQLYELLDRLGFFDGKDIIYESFAATGLFYGEQMKKDYSLNKDLYQGEITDSTFTRNISNHYTFFKNNAKLVADQNDVKPGDIVFLGDEPHITAIVTVVKGANNNTNKIILVTYVGPGKVGRTEYKLDQIAKDNGGIKDIFRVP